MTNTNIQGVIPLMGPGLRYREHGNYQPGEYSKLKNVEVRNGVLKTRNPVRAASVGNNPAWGYRSDILGVVDGAVWVSHAGSNFMSSIRSQGFDYTIGITTLPQDDYSFNKVVGYFKYNREYYWITLSNVRDVPNSKCTYTINVYRSSTTVIDFTTADSVQVSTIESSLWDRIPFKGFYIFKERLWITTTTDVYFSKATDPLVFTIPEGGYLKIADQEITCSASLNDSVFIGTSTGIHVFSYSVDPNEDGYMRPITGKLGVSSLTVSQNRVYASNSQSLYSITNGNVQTILDFEDVIPGGLDSYFSLTVFKNYLYIVGYRFTSDEYGNEYRTPYEYTNLGNPPPIIVLNLDTGTVFEFEVRDKIYEHYIEDQGHIIDVVSLDSIDTNDPTLVLVLGNSSTKLTTFYLMGYSENSYAAKGVDLLYDTATGLSNTFKTKQEVCIEGYEPDGSSHMMKKFRYLLGMAKLPKRDFQLSISMDNYEPSKTILVDSNNVEGDFNRPHFPFKVGVNQRGRKVTLNFNTVNHEEPLPILTNMSFEISDLRMFWSYTQRTVSTVSDAK